VRPKRPSPAPKVAVRSHPDGLCQYQTRWKRGWDSVTTHAGRRVCPVDLRRRLYEPQLGHLPPATLLGLQEDPQDAHTQSGNGPFRNVFVPRPSVLLSGQALGFAVGANLSEPVGPFGSRTQIDPWVRSRPAWREVAPRGPPFVVRNGVVAAPERLSLAHLEQSSRIARCWTTVGWMIPEFSSSAGGELLLTGAAGS
jgi:hypothetical protein